MLAVENPLCFAGRKSPPRRACSRERERSYRPGSRRLRARSSPVHTGAKAGKDLNVLLRGHSDNTSVVACQSPPAASGPPSPYTECDETYFLLKQSEENSNSAYFSTQPPSEPLRVVVRTGPEPLSPASRHSPLLFLPPASRLSPMFLLSPTPYAAPPATPPKKIHHPRKRTRESEARRASRHVVRDLLADLTMQLPLPLPVPVSTPEHTTNPVDFIPYDQNCCMEVMSVKATTEAEAPLEQDDQSSANEVVTASGDAGVSVVLTGRRPLTTVTDDLGDHDLGSPAATDDLGHPAASGVRHNVAVQAHARSFRKPQDNTKTTREAQAESVACPPEEWIGDVRALRDSHVRLVRRELRHIARLNRTLDHAGQYPQPIQQPVQQPVQPVRPNQPIEPAQPTQPAQPQHSKQPTESKQFAQQKQTRSKHRRSSRARE